MARKSGNARAAEDDGLDLDYSERAGFLTGKAAAIADWQAKREKREYGKLFARLDARKRRLADPEGARARCRAWRRNNPERARRLDRAQKIRRYKPRACVCVECGATWKTKRGERKRRYCDHRCRNRWGGKHRKPRNRGIRYMSVSADVERVLRGEPWLTAREIHGRLPKAKFGSIATLLSTWVKAGRLQHRKVCRGTRYALAEGKS